MLPNVDSMTIIPPNGKMTNGNGLICINHNGNGKIPNGKSLEIGAMEKGKSVVPIEKKSAGFHTDFIDDEVSCGWGLFRPRFLQFFATKQWFLVTFCLTWVKNFFL